MNVVISGSPELSQKTRKLLGQITRDIDSLAKDQASLEADTQAVRSMNAADMSGGQLDVLRGLPSRRLDLMRRELAIRNRLEAEFYPARQSDRMEASSRADAKYEQAMADVRQKLLSIGYVDGPISDGVFNSITPDMMGRHPAVFAARNERNAALAIQTSHEDAQLNTREIQQPLQTFEQIKQRAMSAVA
jgi:hypothetical protein